MSCKIIRDSHTGAISHVTAPNGQKSQLFDTIKAKHPTWSDEQLLREYAKYYTSDFQAKIREAKESDKSFDLDLDTKLRDILTRLYPEIELSYTDDVITATNKFYNQLEEQYKEVDQTVTLNLDDLLLIVPDNPSQLTSKIISETDEKLIKLLASNDPTANLTNLASNLVALGNPAYRNYEYNKRLYQIQEYKKQLKDRNDNSGLEILQELENLLLNNKAHFIESALKYQNENVKRAFGGGEKSLAIGIINEILMGGVFGFKPTYVFLAFAAPTLGFEAIITSALAAWGTYTTGAITNNIRKGLKLKTKAQDFKQKQGLITEFLDIGFLKSTKEFLELELSRLATTFTLSGGATNSPYAQALRNLPDIDHSAYYKRSTEDQERIEAEKLRIILERGKQHEGQDNFTDRQNYVDYRNIYFQLQTVNNLIEKVEANPVFLKEIEVNHRFKHLVDEIYSLSDTITTSNKEITGQQVAQNVLEAIRGDSSNIINTDLKRIFVRSGLARDPNNKFSQDLFKEDILHILMAEEIKIKGNTSDYKMDVLHALNQSLEDLDFRTDDLVRKYLSDSVEDATGSPDYFGDYQLASTSFKDILDKINNARDFREKEFYKSVYRQKNEKLASVKASSNVFSFLKTGLYRLLLQQSKSDSNNLLNQEVEKAIIGQANIEAMTVLVHASLQRQDTLPHEYAHHYISWYRNTPLVQEAIAKWGSEEALVQAIGEQAVKQEGQAWAWWKNFVEWILNKFAKLNDTDKETLKNILTDAFLTRADLNAISKSPDTGKVYLYRLQEKDFDINTNTIQRAEQLISEGKAKWWHEQIAKNPERRAEMQARDENYGQWFTDSVEKLDYYLNDKEGDLDVLRITVDKEDLDKYNVGKSGSANAKRFSNRHHDEFIVPKEIIEKAEKFNVSAIPALILTSKTDNQTVFNQTDDNYDFQLQPYATDIWGYVPKQGEDNKFVKKEQYAVMFDRERTGVDIRLTIYFDEDNKTAFVSNIENFKNKSKHPLKKGLGKKAFIKANKLIVDRGFSPVVDTLMSGYGYDMLSQLEKEGYVKKQLDKIPAERQDENVRYPNPPFTFTNKINSQVIFNQTTEIDGALQADKKRLIDLLGGNMYKGNIVDISIKELLQNSFDAVKIAKSQGLIDDGQINIVINEKERTIAFEDNGTGMTSDVVQKAFFTIGGTYKGDNIDNKLKSGGLGLAKMAFIFGSDEIILETVKDGVKTKVQALSNDIRNDNFKIVTSSTKDKNGTRVSVKIPEAYFDNTGESKRIYFPYNISSLGLNSNILSKPIIGDVNVDLTFIDKNNKTTQQKISKGKIPEEYDLFTKASTSFADIDIYVNFNNLKDNIEKGAHVEHIILSSGLYQFQHSFTDGNFKKAPFDIIVNIKPKVSPTEQNYPFNNQREDFRPTVKEDISALDYYIEMIWTSIKKEIYTDSFSNILNVDNIDLNLVDEKSIKENARALNRILKQDPDGSSMKSKALIFLKQATEGEPELNIENGNIETKKRRITKEEQKEYGKTFKADRKVTLKDSGISELLDVNQPVIHNNTKMIFNETESEFLIKFANLMLAYKKQIVEHYGNNYSPDIENQFWGISIDKDYYGVNVSESILPLVSVNPFSIFPKDDIRGKTNRDLANYIVVALDHLIIHELNHNFESGEGANFTFKFLSTYADVHSLPNYYSLINSLKKLVFDNLETIKKLNNEYQLTENLRISLKTNNFGNFDEGRADKRAEVISTDNPQDDGGSNTADYRSNNEFGENLIYKLNENNQFYQLQEITDNQKEKAITELDKYLLNYLKQFNVHSKEFEELKSRLGVDALGATDVLNKLIWYVKNRNAETVPEEVGHMLTMLMGKNNPIMRELLIEIVNWSEYSDVKRNYSSIYNNNEEKIKIEAIGKLLAKSLIKNYKASGLDKSLLEKAIDYINDLFKNIVSLFDAYNYSTYLGDKVAINVLLGKTDFITNLVDSKSKINKKVNYKNALESNPLAKQIIKEFSEDLNFPLTGSLAIAGQNEDIYRSESEPIHDLDFVVDGRNSNTLDNLRKKLKEYKAIRVHSGWKHSKEGYTTYAFYIPKKGYSVSVLEVKNGWVSKIEVKDENNLTVPISSQNVISVDFFIYSEEPYHRQINNFVSWQDVFKGKLSLSVQKNPVLFSRDKDQVDYLLLNPKNRNFISDPAFIYYQLGDSVTDKAVAVGDPRPVSLNQNPFETVNLDTNREILPVQYNLEDIVLDYKYDYEGSEENLFVKIHFDNKNDGKRYALGLITLGFGSNSWTVTDLIVDPLYKSNDLNNQILKLLAKDAYEANLTLKSEVPDIKVTKGEIFYDPRTDTYDKEPINSRFSKGYIENIRSQTKYPAYSEFADNFTNPKYDFVVREIGTDNLNYEFDPATDTIYVNPDADISTKYQAVLTGHVKGSVLNSLSDLEGYNTQLLKSFLELLKQRLRRYAFDQYIDLNHTSIIDMLFNDPLFVELVKNIPADPGYAFLVDSRISEPSLYDQILKIFGNINNIPSDQLAALDLLITTKGDDFKNNTIPDSIDHFEHNEITPGSFLSDGGLSADDLIRIYNTRLQNGLHEPDWSNFPVSRKAKKKIRKSLKFSDAQKQSADQFQKISDSLSKVEIVSIEDIEKSAKGFTKETLAKVRLMKKFTDRSARYILMKDDGTEIIIPLRPSDLGKLEFAKNRTKLEIDQMDASRENIILRGMGTTLHMVQQHIVKELESQNADNALLTAYSIGTHEDFYQKHHKKFMSKISDTKLKEIYDSLTKKKKYTNVLSREELLGITDADIADKDRNFTIDMADFENLMKLSFKLYHQIYQNQKNLDRHRDTKGKPMVLTEVKVFDEGNGIAGSIDLIAIYQDGDNVKYGFYDYKFISFNKEMPKKKGGDEETLKKQKVSGTWINKEGLEVTKDPDFIYTRQYSDSAVQDKLRAKSNSYDFQISAYKQALINSYSLKKDDIMESRVIPVNMILKTEKTGAKISRPNSSGKIESTDDIRIIPTIDFIDHDNELLSQIPFANELTDDKRLNRFIEQLFTKRNELTRLKRLRPDDERIVKQLKDLEFILRKIQLKKDIKAVAQRLISISNDLERALSNQKYITDKKTKKKRFNPLHVDDEGLNIIEELTKLYDNFSEHVVFEYESLQKEVTELREKSKKTSLTKVEEATIKEFEEIDAALTKQGNKIRLLREKIKEARHSRLLEYAEKGTGVDLNETLTVDLHISKEDLINMGIGSLSNESMFSDISSLQANLYGISDWDNPISYMAKEIFDNINTDIKTYLEDVTKKIHKQRENLRKYANSKGIPPLSVFELFVDDRFGQGRFVSKQDISFFKAKSKAIADSDLKWLKENIIFDKERFDEQYKKYNEYLNKVYNLSDPKNDLEKVKQIKERLNYFELRYNMDKHDSAYYNTRNYFWKVNPIHESKWESQKWKTIKSDPTLLEFHDFYLAMMDELREMTGDQRINKAFLPQIHRDTGDILSKDFLNFDAIKNIYTSFIETSRIREEDESLGVVINDEVLDEVPLRFSSPIRYDNLLTDLTKSLLLMAYSAKTYQSANAAKGTLEMIKLAIADTKLTQKDARGHKIKDRFITGDTSKLYEAYTKQLRYYLYGQTIQPGMLSKGSGGAGEISAEKIIRKIIGYYSTKSLAFNTKTIFGSYINNKLQLRQLAKKGNHFTTKQLNETELLFSKTSKEAHIFREMFKLSQEGNSGLVHEDANKLSISKLREVWHKPVSYLFHREADDSLDSHVLFAMLKNYALHPDGKTLISLTKKDKYLKGTKWENAEIKSMWDSLVFDETGKDADAPMYVTFFDGTGKMTKSQFMQFRQRARTIVTRARGNSSAEDRANYRNTLEGQLIGHFKSWVPVTLLLERTGQARYNYSLDELEIGRYRVFLGEAFMGIKPKVQTFAKMLLAVTLFRSKNLADQEISKGFYNRWRLENPEHADKVTFEEFMKTRSDQLAAFASELRMYLLVKLALLSIGFAAGDKERKKHPVVRLLSSHINRVLLELGFYFNPKETVQIVTRGPVPLFNMVLELFNLVGNTVGETTDFIAGVGPGKKISFLKPGDESFSFDFWKEVPDRKGPFTYAFKFVPGLKGMVDLLNLTNAPKDKPSLLEWMFGIKMEDEFYKFNRL